MTSSIMAKTWISVFAKSFVIFMNMLMLILMNYCLPVRSSDYTGVRTDKNEYIKSVFLHFNCRKPDGSCVNLETENDVDADQPDQQMSKQRFRFKNPEYIWGKDFNNSNAKSLCEACVFARGGGEETTQFTKRGVGLCSKVCKRQEQRILRVAPTKATLADSYCTKKRLIAATCVCVFKVTCQEYNHYAFTHFITSRTGHVALLYFEAGHPITANLDTL